MPIDPKDRAAREAVLKQLSAKKTAPVQRKLGTIPNSGQYSTTGTAASSRSAPGGVVQREGPRPTQTRPTLTRPIQTKAQASRSKRFDVEGMLGRLSKKKKEASNPQMRVRNYLRQSGVRRS